MLADDLIAGAPRAAAYAGLTTRQIYHLVEIKALPARKLGGRLFFRRSELDRAFSTGAAA